MGSWEFRVTTVMTGTFPPKFMPTPPPPLPPNHYARCVCSCFVESEDEPASTWTELEARSKASVVDRTAVMYLARPVLVRGRGAITTPHVYVKGLQDRILRYVEAPATGAKVAGISSAV